MRRKYLMATVGALALAVGAGLWTFTRTSADQGGDPKVKDEGKPAATLPITQVVLFNSGVGYMQREGEVNGPTRVDLTFATTDINDLLKSLVLQVQDTAGGRVDAISYDSQDPVEKILRSFALDLNGNPTFGQILNQARGEKIEVMRQEKPGANPHKAAGTIIGLESHLEASGKDTTVVVEQLNLLTTEGMLSIPLTQVLSVRFQNQTLESEFRRALQVLAGSHDVQKKKVALQFSGEGKRKVKVGYVVERPIWKTTYRLSVDAAGKLFMQGWAIVENVSDDDWNNVRMVLVSGKPISFRMDLYEPLYIPRPLVEPELLASLRPPVYGGSMLETQLPVPEKREEATKGLIRGGTANGAIGASQFGSPLDAKKALDKARWQKSINDQWYPDLQNQKLGYDELLRRQQALKNGIYKDKEFAKEIAGKIAGLDLKEGIQSLASSEEIGDYYQYIIDQKISLPRQKSAMLPIVNETIAGSKVSIYNEAIHTKYPLLGIRLKNTSGKPLTQGPITVYEDNSYAGDTRTLDLQPNEERLLSYAVDQGTEVKTAVTTHPAPDMTFKIGGNNLTAVYTMRQTTTYTFKNRSTHDRTVIFEHPIRSDWKLVDPKKPNDKTRDVYRFEVVVKAGELISRDVVEEQARTDPVALQAGDRAPYYALIGGIEIKPEVKGTGPKLQSLSIRKGVLEGTYHDKESKTYFIQNNSERDHSFTVDHIIRKDWKRIVEGGKEQVGPAVFTFKVAVASKKTAQQEVVEETVYQDRSLVLLTLDDDALRRFIANKAPSANVKAQLQKVLDLRGELATATKKLADAKTDLKILAEDQARVRENLKIIPQNSEHYNNFLKKFVAQEAQIEEAQKQMRTMEAAVQKMQKEHEAFVTGLTVQ